VLHPFHLGEGPVVVRDVQDHLGAFSDEPPHVIGKSVFEADRRGEGNLRVTEDHVPVARLPEIRIEVLEQRVDGGELLLVGEVLREGNEVDFVVRLDPLPRREEDRPIVVQPFLDPVTVSKL